MLELRLPRRLPAAEVGAFTDASGCGCNCVGAPAPRGERAAREARVGRADRLHRRSAAREEGTRRHKSKYRRSHFDSNDGLY